MTPALPLEVRNLSLRGGGLPKARKLFDALSFQVQPRQRWVILGPNGAGKSSLLAAMAGVFAWNAGEVRLHGKSLHDWPAPSLADWRAWCPQFWADPFPASVAQTVCLARDRGAWWSVRDTSDGDAQVQRVVDQLDLRELAGADVRTLSGGERQRVAVATALLQGAPLLLLDEPASHLDLAHQHLLVNVLRAHADAGGAVVTSLHDLNLAWDLASHAVLLDGRGGACAGAKDEVMTPARLAAVFGVAVDQVEVCGQRRFWVGSAALRDEVPR
jgi:iron complex transport system ATP-binding protein